MVLFGRIKRIHFVGIGGIGMSGIAEVLINMGFRVTGSDLKASPITERLQNLGAEVHYGHRAEHVGGANVVVYSSAVRIDNIELQAARQVLIPVIPRAEMLAELMRMKFSIAVAGTHGKTTTTSMVAGILSAAGYDPTIVVGGRLRGLGTNARLGAGEYLVAEADESDRSFLKLLPTIAVVTSIEEEHLDNYTDLREIERAFIEFCNKVPFYGCAVVALDEKNVQAILPEVTRRTVTYGFVSQAQVRGSDVELNAFASRCMVRTNGSTLGRLEISIPGVHNVANALAALAVGLELGIDADIALESLRKFSGVHRRFEIKGEVGGVLVVDDYAHHPTEVEATLRTARQVGKQRVIAVFQPHLYSRTFRLQEGFGRSFNEATMLVVTDIYPAREDPIDGVTGELIADRAREFGHRHVAYIPNREEICEHLARIVRPGDLVITLGAGDIWRVAEDLINRLEALSLEGKGG